MSQPSLRPLLLALALLALTGCSPLNSTQKSNAAQAGVATTKPSPKPGAQAVAAVATKTLRPGLAYPAFARGEHRDTYFGETVADPYRVMENVDDPAVRAWVAGQNQLAEPYLTGIPARASLKDRLTKLWTFERFGLPARYGQRYFFQRNDGRQNQSVLYVADALDAAPRILIDPNTFSKDATVSLASYDIAPQGELIAYAVSDGGTDWRTWRIRRVADGQDLTDELHLTKFTSIAWMPDGKSFFYSRYPQRAGDTTGLVGDDRQQVTVYYHVVGQPQTADVPVYAVTDHKTRNPYATVSDDGRWLLIGISDGFDRNAIHVADLTGWQPGKPLPLQRTLDQWDGLYGFLGNDAGVLYFQTTSGAPRGRIIAVDMSRPAANDWQTLVPEAAETISNASYVGGKFVVNVLQDARSRVRLYSRNGVALGEVPLPGLGSAAGFGGRGDDTETFFSYTDYLTPAAVYRYDMTTGTTQLFRSPSVDFRGADYVTEQVFYQSKDGTRVPMFLTYRRDLPKDGRRPTLLYGYGGFDVSLTPGFSVPIAVWLEQGGIYAVANLRGGGEYGAAWHEAGTKQRKQNVFDDFIAAGEWLVQSGWTAPDRLAIHGRSNGGLLIGATLLQRPDLFAAALPGVGVLDMLRYHTASANARGWSSDYGLSEVESDYRALKQYSPVHNVLEGRCYPPTLITTADHDDRVVPWNSFKFGAALQHAQGCPNPVLLRVETRAGHGAGKPTWMQVEDWADQFAFLFRHLQMPGGAPNSANDAGTGNTAQD